MMNMRKSLMATAMVAELAGCAGHLKVYDENQIEIKGVPFRSAEVFIKSGEYSKHSQGGFCAPSPFSETVPLPTGKLYFVTAESAQFAKTGFHIKFSDNGSVAEIGLDSEPAAADTLNAANDIIKSLAPTVGIAATAGVAALTAPPQKACDTGESNIKFTKFDDYIRPKL